MANERLRDALLRNGMTPQLLAEKVGVDGKTAERWITVGRTPYPRHRHEIAALIRESESYLWPDALTKDRAEKVAASEIVRVYPHRASVPADLWRRLFHSASESLDILVFSGIFLPDQNPRLAKTLRMKAEAGATIRVLLGDPDSAQVAERGEEEGIGEAMAGKIRNVLVHYRELAGVPGVELRLHATTLYNSIYRFDDEMLVNSHVYGFPAAHAPVLHLRKLSAGILFDTYAESFKKVWGSARPAWEPDPAG
jgi:transcriptional regulator with XRE-family HTH domain